MAASPKPWRAATRASTSTASAPRIFCDCTGDSRLALEAGAEMRTGREARSEFDESLAPESPDNDTLGSSILFTSRLYPHADAVHSA